MIILEKLKKQYDYNEIDLIEKVLKDSNSIQFLLITEDELNFEKKNFEWKLKQFTSSILKF